MTLTMERMGQLALAFLTQVSKSETDEPMGDQMADGLVEDLVKTAAQVPRELNATVFDFFELFRTALPVADLPAFNRAISKFEQGLAGTA
jgi:hypothetical protein